MEFKVLNAKNEPVCDVDSKGDPIRFFHLKPDSKYRVVDVDENRVSDLANLQFATWTTKDFHIRNVYLQDRKTKFAASSVYTKLGYSRGDYVPREDDEATEAAASTNESS